jgi:prephenate dehydrogenase
MKVAILGAAGKMGKWFVQYFTDMNYDLTVSDIKKEELKRLTKSYRVKLVKNNLEAVKDADLTVVSVPINKTTDVLNEITPKLKKGSIVSEIASLKVCVIDVLRECAKFNVQPLSLHPLFGPLWRGKKRFALIPVLNSERELEIAKKIFPDADFRFVDAEKHDKIMALILSLPYFINMALASTLKDEDFRMLTNFGGTTYTLQLILMGSIMAQDSEFHFLLHKLNRNSLKYFERFMSNANRIIEIIKNGNAKEFKAFHKTVNDGLSRSLDLNALYSKMYAAIEFLEKL